MPEPLAIEFANTWYAVRGKEMEGVGTPAELARWLREHDLPAEAEAAADEDTDANANTYADIAITDDAVRDFLTLRDAIRSLLHATTEREPLPKADTETVNRASSQAPRWPVLAGTAASGYSVAEMATVDPLPSARGQIARDAIALLGGPLRADVRACHAPGCVQYFIKDHPRREWCSAACGNRARVARHYTKSKDS
jgi:predicted RNA-binding Zn ribbon-like protein